jgi:hypothetical protein
MAADLEGSMSIIRLLAKQDGKSRLATFQGREHIVVPVVMLVEGVMHAINQPAPELVLEEEFSKQPQGWNGRPVCGGHPQLHGEFVSASITPDVLEMESFGTLFNTFVKGKKLATEAWIDPVRAAAHPIGVDVLERLKAGEEVLEISVGVFARTEPASGIWADGKKYEGIWRDLVPDHLAILAKGDIGACSVQAGCGAMRAAKETTMIKGVKERFKEFIASMTKEASDLADASASDGDVRHQLNRLLRAEEPGFLGVEEVFSADGQVVFATMPADRFLLIRRNFTVDGATVTLGDGRTEVEFVQSFEPVAAGAAPKTACGCSGHQEETTAVPAAASGETNMNKTDRINALIASNKLGPGMTAKVLEAMTEDAIKVIEDSVAALPTETPAPTTVAAAAPVVSGLTDEDREILKDAREAREAKKNGFLTAIKANKGNEFSDAELAAMPLTTLERLAKLVTQPVAVPPPSGVDFSGIGLPRVGSQNQDNSIPAPPNMITAIQEHRKAH